MDNSLSQVRVIWQELVDESDRVDYSLEETKKLFSETTKKQVGRDTTQTWGGVREGEGPVSILKDHHPRDPLSTHVFFPPSP